MSIQKVEMTVEQKENGQYVQQVAYPFVEYDHVAMESGMDIMSMIRDDVSTPLVTHDTTSWKVGQGDGDVSESIVDSSVASMTIKGQTYQNILPEPSLRNSMTNGKTMQKLNEGYDSVNTVDGVCKSAILSGQTLVNLVPKKIIDHIASSDWDGYCCLVQNSKQSFDQWRTLQDLKPNTKYYISCYVETFEDANNKDYCLNNPSVESIFGDSMIINGVGRYQWLSTTKSELTDEIFIVLRSQNANARGAIKIRDIMIIEYQDGMENWDIPYFEGMQSVKMPVLTTSNEDGTKTNILTINEEVELRGIGDVKDELNLLTGELTQRIGEVVLDGSEDENWVSLGLSGTGNSIGFYIPINNKKNVVVKCDKLPLTYYDDIVGIKQGGSESVLQIRMTTEYLASLDLNSFKMWLSQNPITVQYPLATESIKTVDLSVLDQDNQPVAQLNSFANGYIQVSSQEGTLIPTTEYEVPTSNSYHVDLMKPNTQYTMKNMQGTFTIDGIQYNASVNGTFTTPSTLSNRLMITNVVQTQPMLLEGDITSKEVPYVEGIKSAFEGADKVEIVSQNADNSLSNTTSFQLAHPLRSLPNSVRDEIVLDRVNHKAKIIQRVGEDLTQLDTPIITEVNLEGYPYICKGGHIFLNTEIAPTTEVTYSINQAHQIESSNEDILRHQKEINHLYELIAQYVQVQYETELIDIALQG